MLLSSNKEGLQQHLDLLHRFWQTWALTVNLSKTKITVFQNRSRYQDYEYKFHLDTVALEHTKNYTYLSLNISTTDNFHKAVTYLRQDKKGLLCHQKKRNIQHKLECYLALNREYTVAEYLTTVTDLKIKEIFDDVQTQ